jgi:hypothetical protein
MFQMLVEEHYQVLQQCGRDKILISYRRDKILHLLVFLNF